MTDVVAYQHGTYPRSEAVVAATRDAERARTTADVVDERYRDDLAAFVRIQQEAGLDRFSDGLITWQDLLRPLVEAAPGMRARTLVRWAANNSFYRAPELEEGAAIQPLGSIPAAFDASATVLVPEPRVATLPSPYLFSRAAHTDGDRDALLRDVARNLLAPVAAALPDRGYTLVHLEEPWLPYFGIDDGAWPALEDGIASIHDALGGRAALVLHAYFGDAGPYADRLTKLPVDAVGIDFAETDLDSLGRGWPVGVVVGCLDGRRSLIEPPEEVAAFARRVAEKLAPPTLYLSSNTELEMLPAEVARRKVLALGQAARLLRDALA